MSGCADSSYEYQERPMRSPDREYYRSERERSGSSSSARYRDRSPRDNRRSPRNEHRRGYRSSSRKRELSRERDRKRDRDRSRHSSYERKSSRERSYSRSRRSSGQNDSDDGRRRYSSRDRHYKERYANRRRRSYDDDRSSRGNSYDSSRSKRDSDCDRSSPRWSRGINDKWLAHVWGEENCPGNLGGGVGSSSLDHENDGPYEKFDRSSYKSQTPNKTLILRGLAPYITERDIREEIIQAGGRPRDIRLIRKRDVGSSRCFAFVELNSTEEARSMVERHDGEFQLLDQRVIMQYSIQRDFTKETSADWYCRCSTLNFKRREFCFKCGSDRRSGECSDFDEISSHPTHTVLLKGLDSSTTEENVLRAIQMLSSLAIRSVRIGRDKVTNVSRGVCYIEMNKVSDAMYLHNTLLKERLRINDRLVHISYCKSIPASTAVSSCGVSNAGNAAIAAAQWSHQKNNDSSSHYTLQDVPRLAECSASMYAKTPAEQEAFVKHYTDYYTNVINEGGVIPSLDSFGLNPSSIGSQDGGSADSISATSTVASAAASSLPIAPSNEIPSGNGEYCYPVPDVSAYQYEKTSGYYYDPKTMLYYDANSQYYFNSKTNKFLYWDGNRKTYLLAPNDLASKGQNLANTSQVGQTGDSTSIDDNTEENKAEDGNKVKVAKRIAKDMEKWAKTLNHKKEYAKQNLIASQTTPVLKTLGAADIGYAVGMLGRKDSNQVLENAHVGPNTGPIPATNDSLVAEYGEGSDSEDETVKMLQLLQDDTLVDWGKMACLLCKRAFPNRETLLKHQQFSELHKQNLEAFNRSIGVNVEDAKQKSVQYRDRAEERRLKYNEPDVPPTNRLKENYARSCDATVNYGEPARKKIGSDNVGNKMLQKMGWQQGMGLGKCNQGRTDIIQAEVRPMSAGLGIRSLGVTPGPGETYKDCVKKMMRARYEEVNN